MTVSKGLILAATASVVGFSAFAADLPAKKAAPAAAASSGCPAYGAGFIAIPGTDTCIQISGMVRVQDKAGIAPSPATGIPVNIFNSYFRLNADTRNNTEFGTVRGYGRVVADTTYDSTLAVKNPVYLNYGYVQLGGFSAGLMDSAFLGYNSDKVQIIATDDGKGDTLEANPIGSAGYRSGVANALSYTASLGSAGSLIFSLEDATNRSSYAATGGKYDGTGTAKVGASQIPDMVGAWKIKVGDVELKLAAATHQIYGKNNGALQGYAGMFYAKMPVSKETTLIGEVVGTRGANSYLGVADLVKNYDVNSADTDISSSSMAAGYNLIGGVSQVAGPGLFNLFATLGGVEKMSSTAGTETSTPIRVTQYEMNYNYNVAKGFVVTPALAFTHKDDNGSITDATIAQLRIQRDF